MSLGRISVFGLFIFIVSCKKYIIKLITMNKFISLIKIKAIIGALFVCSAITVSCTNEPILRVISVNPESDDAEKIMKEITVVSILQLDNSVPIGQIRKMQKNDNSYYILNKSTEEILCFNESGGVSFVISDKGRGPREYLAIDNFFVDQSDNTIVVLTTNKILRYSAQDGSLISVKDVSYLFINDGIMLDSKTEALYTMGSEYNLTITDKSNDVIKYHIPFLEGRDLAFTNKAFAAQSDNNILFCHGMNDTIYSIKSIDMVSPYCYVDFGSYKIDPNLYLEENGESKIQSIYESREVAVKLDDISASNNFISFSYWLMPPNSTDININHVMYNISKGASYNMKSNSCYLFPISDVTKDGVFISVVHPVSIIGHEFNLEDVNKFISDNNIKDDNNPLIIIWKLH